MLHEDVYNQVIPLLYLKYKSYNTSLNKTGLLESTTSVYKMHTFIIV